MNRLSSVRMHAVVVGIVLCGAGAGVFAQDVTVQKPSSDGIPLDANIEPSLDPLQKQVQEAIDISLKRFLSAESHTPWQIMHGVLALRQDYIIMRGGRKIRALDWISNGATYRGEDWFEKTRYGGRAHPYSGTAYAFEGHPNQFLAILSMADLPMDHEFKAGRYTITMADMVKNAQMEVKRGEEITWTLWALSHYLPPDSTWENKWGEHWSIERLVDMQTEAPPQKAACGGTHGLFALSYARNGYLQTGQPLRGVWISADQKIQRYIEETRAYQNSDGTFSADFFKGRKYARDFKDRLSTSGHTLEFLMVALPQNRLDEPWVRQGLAAVSQELIDNKRSPADCGALYHAMNGLMIYLERTSPRTELAESDDLDPAEASDADEVAKRESAADGLPEIPMPGPEAESEADGRPEATDE